VVIARIFQQAHQTPDKTAAVYNGVTCSYARFAQRVEACRRYLARQELRPRSVAVIDIPHRLDAWIVGFALRDLGHTTLAVPDAETLDALRLRDVGCVVRTADDERPPSNSSSSPRSIRVPAATHDAADGVAVPAYREAAAPAGGHIMMTSGTTGVYKMVVRDAAMEARALPLHARINEISGQSIVYIANFGLWTAGGYRWPLITWSEGGTVIMHAQPDVHAPLVRHDMTHIFATPGTLAHLLRAPAGALRRNDSTQLMVTGGALPLSLLENARRRVTRRVYAVLASTEALTVAVTPLVGPDDLIWHRIHPSREVQVVDEAGNVLAPGSEGSVRIRIIDGLAGYRDDDAATRMFFRDGYFHPGDIGVLGDDGRLSLRGRASDVINILGDKIATGTIEQVLQDELGATGVCILSIGNAGTADEIYIVIEVRRPLQPEVVKSAANAALGVLKRVPVHALLVERLPRNATGKIDRRLLKQQLADALDANSGQRLTRLA